MIPSVEKILRDHYVDGVFHTHVSMVQPRGKFQFNRQDLEKFWEIYSERILSDEASILGVAEKPQHYLPVLVDIDIKLKDINEKNTQKHLYSENHVKQLVEIYQSVLRNIVDDCTDENLTCVLLEKPIYYISTSDITYIKNGFHLHFPDLFLSKVDQEVHLIPRIKEIVKNEDIFADIGIEDSSSVVDKSYCTVPWLVYGSRKAENMDPYTITKIFDSEGNEISMNKAFKYYSLYDINENLINIRDNIPKYLPRILSIIPYGRKTYEVKHGIISPLKEKFKEEKKQKTQVSISAQEALKISHELLPMLSSFRAEDRNEWITIGWILYNIGDGSVQAMEQWMEFSARCEDKYDEASCIYHWERMVKKDLTLATLRYYANMDNPEQYKAFKKKQAENHVKESLNGSHNDIAKVLYAEFGNEFVCASITGKIWFQFKNHKWEEIEEGIYLREKISSQIVLKYTEMGKDIFLKLSTVEDKATEAMYNARLKQVQKIISNLKSCPYKNNIMKEAMEVFYDRRFKDKLDQNPYLIGFKNGVYDLKLNMMRSGRPEDFISKTLPIEYKEYTKTDEQILDIEDFLLKVFPDESLRKYFLDVYSNIFVGGNLDKKVYMWTGEGDNAKSITQKIFEMMLGDLAIKFNTQYFTGKKVSSGSANPELSRAAPPVRHVTMEEPDSDEQLNIGELKKLSGGDSYWARDLFEKGKNCREVFPMFMLTFICLDGNTPISLSSGVSITLKNFSQNLFNTFSWDPENKGITYSDVKKFLEKGVQKTVTITLQNGKQISCTPNHKFLTINHEWVEAQYLSIGNSRLIMGISPPICDDMFENTHFNFFGRNLVSVQRKLECMALSRLLGVIFSRRFIRNKIYVSNKVDITPIFDDIILITNKDPKIIKNNVYEINIDEIVSFFSEHINLGNEDPYIYRNSIIPYSFLSDNCPLFLLREFIASMFSSHAIVSSFRDRHMTSFKILFSKHTKLSKKSISVYKNISDLLKSRFSINSSICYSRVGEDLVNIYISFNTKADILSYCKNIGFRYSYNNIYRIEAISSCLKYEHAVNKQNHWIVDTFHKEIKQKPKLIRVFKAQSVYDKVKQLYIDTHNFYDENMCINFSDLQKYWLSDQRYKNRSIDFSKFLFESCLDTFLCNVYNQREHSYYFIDKNIELLPSFNMKVVSVKNSGDKYVYDLNMDEYYSNFLANGVVTHNCNKLPKFRNSDKATWNRIIVIPFESTFVAAGSPCPIKLEDQIKEKRFPMDKEFGKKIPGMISAFAWYLLEWRQKITTKVEPEKVKEATNIYRKQNDIYRQYIEECIIEDDNSISITELYAQFKEWFKEGWPNNSVPIKNDIKEYFENLWGVPKPGIIWHGYRIRTLQDDINSGDAIIMENDDFAKYESDEQTVPPL